jgi:hypothetical protein
VKSIIQQFNLLKSKGDETLDEGMEKLLMLARNIEFEEELARRDGEEGAGGEDDNVESQVDEHMLMTEGKLNKLDESVDLCGYC